MQPTFWDQRFSEDEPVYGHAPNEFFAEELSKLTPGKLLLPAEGQGRNAIHAAKMGWEVEAFDFSTKAREDALAEAERQGVSLTYRTMSYQDLDLPVGYFDAVALVFAHMDPQLRPEVHGQIARSLKPGGTLILEGFHKKQLPLGTGGPKSEPMLFSQEELTRDFNPYLADLRIEQPRITLSEGPYHQGEAEVIRLVGRRDEE